MLDSQTIATVKSTIPLLSATGPKLNAHFYDRMFMHHPELKDIFNMNNQRNGDQRHLRLCQQYRKLGGAAASSGAHRTKTYQLQHSARSV